MKFKLLIAKLSIISTILIYNNNILADETFVYCADKDKNWQWLNNGNEKVTGTWKTEVLDNSYYNYFLLDGGLRKIWTLKLKCKQEFGELFIYAQPANNRFATWSPFAINDKFILDGYISYISLRDFN